MNRSCGLFHGMASLLAIRLVLVDVLLNLHARLSHLAEGNGWFPADALPRTTGLSVRLVHLLQRQALGLIDHKKGDAEEAAVELDEEDLGLQICVSLPVVHQVWGRVGDGPSQLEAVVIERDFTRTLSGKIRL
jgi:hypothetical protein